ncbi:MAG: NADPH-dependent F420 reductase [Chitinophagaceae bacterium]
MNIAILGAGRVGAALATNWAQKGHTIRIGARDKESFRSPELLKNARTSLHSIREAVQASDTVLIATPPTAIFSIHEELGDVSGKVIIDATNNVQANIDPYATVYHCLTDRTRAEVVKCFNSTGFENMLNPIYPDGPLDMFMAGDSDRAKDIAKQLALDCGFGSCIDFGSSDKVSLLEKFALCWINLATRQGLGRNTGFRLVHR